MAPGERTKELRYAGKVVPLALAFMLVMGAVAFADDISNNLDDSVDADLELMDLTAGGATGVVTFRYIPTNDDSKSGCNLNGQGSQLVVGVNSDDNTVATVSVSSLTWAACGETKTVTITPVGEGTAKVSLTYTSVRTSVANIDGDDFDLAPAAFTVNVTTPVPANMAPSAPGKPSAAPASPNQGGFTLDWTASTDDGNPTPPGAITYELQAKDADDGAFGAVASASALSMHSYVFTAGAPDEGTWTYRVRANDSGLTSDWSASSDPIVVDRTAPTVGSCPTGGPFLLNSGDGSQNLGPITASDTNLPDGSSGSGVDYFSSNLSGTVDTTSVGSKNVLFTAVDRAGNSRDVSCSYSVVYAFDGFFEPVNNPGWTEKGAVINKAVAGKTIPLKWRLTDANGVPVVNLGSVNMKAVSLNCLLGTTPDMLEEYASGNSGLQNLGNGYYQFNWATPKAYAASCKTLELTLNDSTVHTAYFQFTK